MKRLLLIVGLAFFGTFASAAGDGSGSAPGPKSPGGGPAIGGVVGPGGNVSTGGLGIQPDAFTGAATFSVPISLPPGRGGLAPQLALDYNSYRRNPNSYVGYGWDLSLGEIIRTAGKAGMVDYKAGQDFELRLFGQVEQLRLLSSNVNPEDYGIQVPAGMTVEKYEARVDIARNIYLHIVGEGKDGGWVVIDKGGTRYEFGVNFGTQSKDYTVGMIARWLLDRVTDANGNTITIEYGNQDDGGGGVVSDFHPNRIIYGDITVEFQKADQEKVRYFPAFREGFFHWSQGSRLDSIIVYSSTGAGKTRLLKYEFEYGESSTNHALLLQKIKRLGKTDATSLPSITMTYFGNDALAFSGKEFPVAASAKSTSDYNAGYLGGKAAIMDINGDGVPDSMLGYENSGFLVKLSNGTLAAISNWEGFLDPLNGLCEKNFCVGILNGLYKELKYSYYEWVTTLDINGDSAPDRILRRAGSGIQPKFFIAFGKPGTTGWQEKIVEWPDPDLFFDPGVEDYTAGLVDMNGDGLPDRVVGDAKKGGFNVFYNKGDGFLTEPIFWKDPLAAAAPNHPALGKLEDYDGGRLYVAIRDINGDGLPDRLYRTEFLIPDGAGKWKSEFGIHAAMNKNGLAWGQPIPAKPGSCPEGVTCTYFNSYDTLGIADPLSNTSDKGYIAHDTYDLIDFNHDGYLDRVEGLPASGQIRISYYAGLPPNENTVQFDAPVVLKDPVNDAGQGWKGSGYINKKEGDNLHTFIRDMNGDGFPDRVTMTPRGDTLDKSRTFYVYPLQTNALAFSGLTPVWPSALINQPPNALQSVDNGEGRRTAIEYIQSTGYTKVQSRLLPSILHLVFKHYSQDMDAPVDVTPEGKRHPGMRWATYEYFGGNTYVQLGSNLVPYASRFNGFQQVWLHYAPMGNETWTAYTERLFFHQAKGSVSAALPGDENLESGAYKYPALSGRLYKKQLFESTELRFDEQWAWGLEQATEYSDNPDCPYYDCRPQLSQRKEEIFEAGFAKPRVRAWTYKYDGEGNPVYEEFAAGGFKQYVRDRVYFPASKFKLKIRNRLQVDTVKSGSGDTLRKLKMDYDAAGNPTVESHFSDANNTLSITRKFDSYGNILQWTGTDGVTHTHTYDAESLFPVTESIALPNGQILTTQRGYDRTTGRVMKEIDPHGVGTELVLDDFGRQTEAYAIAASGFKTPSHKWTYEYIPGVILKTRAWEYQPGYAAANPSTVTYSDGNGRTRQSCSLSEKGDYRRIQIRHQNAGRTVLQSDPAFAQDCTLLPNFAGQVSATQLDIFGRPTLIQPPAGDSESPTAPVSIAYGISAENTLNRVTTQPNGTKRTVTINGLGQIVSVYEGAGGTVANYSYNAVGDLLSVVVAGVKQSETAYDWLGRKKTSMDADMGSRSYDYDKFGRLKMQMDAKAQKIEFDYDAIGRVTDKRMIGAGGIEKVENYRYDSAAPGFDPAAVLPGELSQVIEKTGSGGVLRESRFAYDANYRRTAKMQRDIPGIGAFNQTFDYNFKGQLTATTYVGKKSLYYSYNAIGGLKSLCDSASCGGEVYYFINPQDGFDAYGALLKENFGNGVSSQNTYYPLSHRLKSRSTGLKAKIYSKRDYTYNAMASLASITDPQNQLGAAVLSNVTYDGQDRLTGYQPKEGAAVGFKYASNGNILQNDQSYPGKSYVYGSARPHAVTQIGDEQFSYDANGNMQTDAHREMQYSAANQLTQVKMKNGAVVAMDYDFSSARVLKTAVIKDVALKTWQTTTHYLGEALEIRLNPISPLPPGEGQGGGVKQDGVVLLHIYAGGDKIATQTLGQLSDILATQAAGTPAIPTSDADYLVYYHSDPLGSDHLITEGKTKGKHAGITYLKGDVIQRFEYAPFGQEIFALNPNLSWDPAYTGQSYDIETGLYYYKARYYNPILGRFIQPDTIVQDIYDPQSWNRYTYVSNNPLKYTDPSGHFKDPEGNDVDLGDAPHVDSSSDLHDDYHGMAFVDGTMAYVDNRADIHNYEPDDGEPGIYSSERNHEEGGLVGASADQRNIGYGGTGINVSQVVNITPNETWHNPTGQPIRGIDSKGNGAFFAPRAGKNGGVSGHGGLDFVSIGGQPVEAIFSGRVDHVGSYNGMKLVVIGEHYSTPYKDAFKAKELYLSDVTVKAGDIVQAGQIIGYAADIVPHYGSGMTNHTHVQVQYGNMFVDPTGWFSK